MALEGRIPVYLRCRNTGHSTHWQQGSVQSPVETHVEKIYGAVAIRRRLTNPLGRRPHDPWLSDSPLIPARDDVGQILLFGLGLFD